MGTPETFWARVDRRGPSECWLWTGSVSKGGYGTLKFRNKYDYAHRVAWELTFGEIPEGSPLELMHLCKNEPINRRCCNPRHMALGPHKANMEDQVAKGRSHYPRPGAVGKYVGEKSPHAVLTNAQAEEIRRRLATGESQMAVALSFNVSQHTVSMIHLGHRYPEQK